VLDKRLKKEEVNLIQEKAPQYMRELIKHKKAIIILDPTWYSIKEGLGIKDIEKKEQQLLDLLKERGGLTNDEKDYYKVKNNLMQQVLAVSQTINENNINSLNLKKYTAELEKLQEGILNVNEKLENIELRLEELDELIENKNLEIMGEVVGRGYVFLEESRLQKQTLEKEIEEMRAALIKKAEEKKKCDSRFVEVYNYLHKIVGYKYVDVIDGKLQKELE
jgi:hypothetical protein